MALLIRNVLLVVNRAARRASAVEGVVLAELRSLGVRCAVRPPPASGEGAETMRRAAAGADAVLVIGGDGTVMAVASALAGSDIPLGTVPGGTGNHVARYLRIPQHPRAALRALLGGEPMKLDLGRVRGGPYFVIGAGVGLDAEIIAGTSAAAKRRWGVLAYVMAGLRTGLRMRPFHVRASVDGKELRERVLMALVLNMGTLFGGRITLAPRARADDGWLDLVLVMANSFGERLAVLQRALRAQPTQSDDLGLHEALAFHRGRTILIDSEVPRSVQADGELVGVTPLGVTLEAGAVTFLRGGSPVS